MSIRKAIAELFGAPLASDHHYRPPGADLSKYVTLREAAAEWRWTESNERARARGCPCGKPATTAEAHGVVGTVPFLWWTCDEHAGATGFHGKTATFDHPGPCPLSEDMGSGGPIGQPPTHFSCTHRSH